MRPRERVLGLGALALVVLLAALLWFFDGPGGRRAVVASAVLTLLVQAVAFALARLAAPGKLLKAWSAGAVLRFVTLIVYALVLVKPLGLPAVPALMSLVAFLFVTTVLESLLLTS